LTFQIDIPPVLGKRKMRQAQIFSGSSHPDLTESICGWLGLEPGKADLGKFSNGETQVQIRKLMLD
jgi:ribose-phosphate pyrophosphokinase